MGTHVSGPSKVVDGGKDLLGYLKDNEAAAGEVCDPFYCIPSCVPRLDPDHDLVNRHIAFSTISSDVTVDHQASLAGR